MATAASSILKLFESKKFYDVTFKVKCGGSWTSFPAHKLVLSIWSPVLAKKFQLNQNDFDNEIEILDLRPSTFHAFLSYLYGSNKELEECKNDVKFVLNLYEAACRYQVQRLKTDCCDILNSSSPNKNNVFELLDAAVLINSNALQGQCFRVLQSETEAILNSQDIESVTPSMVLTLLQLPSLWLSSEYELLTWVFKWAKSYCSKLQNGNSPREIISSFLLYLNFTALKSKEFAILVSNYREFFDEVDCFNIFMNINLPESAELPIWYNTSQNSRHYGKPIEKVESVMLGDGAPELPYSINNLISSKSDTSDVPASIFTPPAEEVVSIANVDTAIANIDTAIANVDTAIAIVDNGSVNCSTSTSNICYPTSDKETMTDVAMDTNNEVTMPLNISLQSSVGNTDDVAMDTRDVPISSNDHLSGLLEIENSRDSSSITEMAERGQKNASVLETIDTEPGTSWESLEPPLHLEKIKKKKIVKLYLLSERKSLPNIGVWEPVLESPLKSGDIKSLSDIIEKQQCNPIAASIIEKRLPINDPLYIRFLSGNR